MKTKDPKVTVAAPKDDANKDTNPYKKGTAKQRLFQWALDKGTFTKSEFLAAHAEMKIESVMSTEVAGKAWFNEFYNKHEVFVDAVE